MYSGGLGQISATDIAQRAASAAAWINGELRRFFDLEQRLSLMMRQAAQIEGAARQAGDLDAAAEAQRQRVAAFELLKDYDGVKARVDDLVARVPGLGAIPIVLLIAAGAAIIAVAGSMAAIFRRATAQESALKLVAAGVLTPADVQKMELERSSVAGGIGALGSIGTMAAMMVAVVVGLPLIADAMKGKK